MKATKKESKIGLVYVLVVFAIIILHHYGYVG